MTLNRSAKKRDENQPEIIEIPLRIVSVANKREHWTKKAKRTKAHRNAAIAAPKTKLPCIVVLTRIAPRKLDGDNLQSGFKAFRDGIADRLGTDDRDPRIHWIYQQERGKPKEYAVRVLTYSYGSQTLEQALKAIGL